MEVDKKKVEPKKGAVNWSFLKSEVDLSQDQDEKNEVIDADKVKIEKKSSFNNSAGKACSIYYNQNCVITEV